MKVTVNLVSIGPSATTVRVDMQSDEGGGVAEVRRWAAKQFARSFEGLLTALMTEVPPSS
jgi:hypothetical protein